MAYEFFQNAMNVGAIQTPTQYYRELEQAAIIDQWENTASLETVSEQDLDENGMFVEGAYTDVCVWVNSIVGEVSTGRKTGYDFLQLLFECIDHPLVMGRFYIIENQYYMSYYDNRVADVVAHLSVRRCNNRLKMIDPENGSVYSIPCIVDYDMAASSNKITTHIITPNNHAVVKVQQNADTNRLFKTNTRFILSGRPFKITGYQNATEQYVNGEPLVGLLEIDMFLDEIWDEDDLENGIAYNGTYNYGIDLVGAGSTMELATGATGTLFADITLNGAEVDGSPVWSSSDEAVVLVDDSGNYSVVGEAGASATVRAAIDGNPDVYAEVEISVVAEETLTPSIYVDPIVDKIRQYDTITFTVTAVYGGVEYAPDVVSVTTTNPNVTLTRQSMGNGFALTCNNRSTDPAEVVIEVENASPSFTASTTVSYDLVSILG